MILPADLRTYIIRPVCDALGAGGEAVEDLLLGTAMQESGCGRRLAQLGGRALGVWQMEPATHNDIWLNYLRFRAPIAGVVGSFLFNGMPHVNQLVGNLYYACAMARVQYLRSPHAIPTDLAGQAALYKLVYNGPGAATPEQYVENYKTIMV